MTTVKQCRDCGAYGPQAKSYCLSSCAAKLYPVPQEPTVEDPLKGYKTPEYCSDVDEKCCSCTRDGFKCCKCVYG